MKFMLPLAGLVALFLSGCATAQRTSQRQSYEVAVNEVCKATGLQRVGPIGHVKKVAPPTPADLIECRLAFEGHSYPYVVSCALDGSIRSFTPKHTWYRPAEAQRATSETLDAACARLDPKVRQVCRQLGWKIYGLTGVAGIFRSGQDYVMTYLKVPGKEAKAILAQTEGAKTFGPVSLTRGFVVTPRGTVLYGANNTTSSDGKVLSWKVD